MLALGIDVGGSGIKGAVVDTRAGTLVTERMRIATPPNTNPQDFLAIIREIITGLNWKAGPVGIGFPGVIHADTIHTAANLNRDLVGLNLPEALQAIAPGPVRVINDADAAGFAEMRHGAGQPYLKSGTVLLLTIGTGIGTVMFVNGILVPNLELGHIEYNGQEAEKFVSERARKVEDLSWKRWSQRFNGFLVYLENLLQPDFIILGGGGVKKTQNFQPHIAIRTPWTFAANGNRAGMIGAALAAAEGLG